MGVNWYATPELLLLPEEAGCPLVISGGRRR
jgi:hypothetical protein